MVAISALWEKYGRSTRQNEARNGPDHPPAEKQQSPFDRLVGATVACVIGDTEHFRQPPGGPAAGAAAPFRPSRSSRATEIATPPLPVRVGRDVRRDRPSLGLPKAAKDLHEPWIQRIGFHTKRWTQDEDNWYTYSVVIPTCHP